MVRRSPWIPFAVASLLFAASVTAQEATPPAEDTPQETVEDVIVVTASRTEQPLNEAPATVTVMSSEQIEQTPADDYGDLLRNIPGLNVAQTSAREINVTSRGSTNTLATSQLVLVDGRSIYLDFFGFVMWDFLPVNMSEIRQIEVVQGPASAVWGANAMTGVINVITKRPKDMIGTSVMVGGGEFSSLFGSVTHAGVSDRLGYKFSLGYAEQEAYDRPTSVQTINGVNLNLFPFENAGTEQPKADIRLDWDLTDDSTFGIAAGYAGTTGIVHTGIGPFSVDTGSNLMFAKAEWGRRALRVGFFANLLDADSVGLLSADLQGRQLPFAFKTDTLNLDVSNTSVIGNSTILTYGANVRQNEFDLQIAPLADSRDEVGAFGQAEFMFGQHVRWMLGARWDDVEVVDPVVSPRTSLMLSPNSRHTLRFSFNRAFRAPSVVNNFLDTRIIVPIAPFPIRVVGNPNLEEESLDAIEAAWVASLGNGVEATLAIYRNETENSIDFFQSASYSATNLPPGIPALFAPCFLFPPGTIVPGNAPGNLIFLCTNPAFLGPLASFAGLQGLLPSDFSYRNIGESTDQGIEVSLRHRANDQWSWFVNASFQDDTDLKGVSALEVNRAPDVRANLGFSYDPGVWFLNANVNYQDEAYWADVLNVRGFTDSATIVNLALGFRFAQERGVFSINASNITDENVQQHIFGDIIGRKITGQVRFQF